MSPSSLLRTSETMMISFSCPWKLSIVLIRIPAGSISFAAVTCPEYGEIKAVFSGSSDSLSINCRDNIQFPFILQAAAIFAGRFVVT